MGLLTLTLPLRIPFLPVQGVIRLAEIIQEQAGQELCDPATIRRELEEAQRQREAGNISEDEMARIEQEVTSRLVRPQQPGESPVTGTGGERHG